MQFWGGCLVFLGTPRRQKAVFSLEGCSKSKVGLFAPKRPRGRFWEPFWHPKGSQNHEKVGSKFDEKLEAKQVSQKGAKSCHYHPWPDHREAPGLGLGG